MKLKAKITPYSSIVGGGVTLFDEAGRVQFQIAILGVAGITKEQSTAISAHIVKAMDADPLTLPDKEV